MTILLTNDDGIWSPGLFALKLELERAGREVVVVAPRSQKSGAGKSVSFEVSVEQVKLKDGSVAYAVEGTPADAVLVAFDLVSDLELVVTGVNQGPNLGIWDLLSSGTVGAAIEAALESVPAISVSYVARSWERYLEMGVEDYKLPARVGAKVAEYVLEQGMPYGVDVININVPEWVRESEIKFRITKLAKVGAKGLYVRHGEGLFKAREWSLECYADPDETTDVGAVLTGYISITPISLSALCVPAYAADLVRKLEEEFRGIRVEEV